VVDTLPFNADLKAMNRLLTLLLFTVTTLGVLPAAASADRWETLKAINWVENPTNHTRFGPKGELGPYQFRSKTWQSYSSLPFSHAVQRDHADAVAVAHYEWIKRGLRGAGIDPNPYNIALAWNCGLTAVTKGRVPASTYRYAEQVTNLVEVLKQRRQQAPAALVAAAPAPAPIPVPVLSLEPDRIGFSRLPVASAPRFVLAEPVVEAPEELPVVRTDRTVVAPVAPAAERPLFVVATTLGAPRFTLLD
jgi:hypothetical protein